ncbi:HvfC/BufC N-terminal domain-containing protein [Bradyrhizobium elkanii]|uniref:HvfC/BufC N-terminal domain-containing protein n=1 Tax=Bradyrhizobium elkanii TaxID=29448 RepID=UPI0005C22342|nr:DNA-binding domain-containing protein [Bradyrhizobium elkanii]
MPTLLELQNAMRRSLVQHDDGAVAAMLAGHIANDRLDIYRNTFFLGLTKALRLCYPVVRRLVGDDFFNGAAQLFIARHPPGAAYLDQYGGEFPEFLRSFPPAASLVYLADVARLEWAINCAIHAPDVEPLNLSNLAAIEPGEQDRVAFVAHPSVRLLRADYPVDDIWRGVLADDDGALANIDIETGSVHLLTERRRTDVEVVRLDEPAWRFMTELCAGHPMQVALDIAGDFDCSTALAEHLALGRFVAFGITHDAVTTSPDRCIRRRV